VGDKEGLAATLVAELVAELAAALVAELVAVLVAALAVVLAAVLAAELAPAFSFLRMARSPRANRVMCPASTIRAMFSELPRHLGNQSLEREQPSARTSPRPRAQWRRLRETWTFLGALSRILRPSGLPDGIDIQTA